MSAHDFVTLGKSLNISEPVSPPEMEMGSPDLTGSLKTKCDKHVRHRAGVPAAVTTPTGLPGPGPGPSTLHMC